MILGFSHLAVNTSAMEKASKRLEAFGYAQEFDAPELPNVPHKAPFMRSYTKYHHIRRFMAPEAMAIELLDYGPRDGPRTSAALPVLRLPHPLDDWKFCDFSTLPLDPACLPAVATAFGDDLQAVHDPVLDMYFLWVRGEGFTGLQAVLVPTPDISGTHALWADLRFSPTGSGIWAFASPFPALKAQLMAVPSKDVPGWTSEPHLDAPGCPCLALMVGELKENLIGLASQPEMATFRLTVNSKPLEIALARPPQGPVLELVRINR